MLNPFKRIETFNPYIYKGRQVSIYDTSLTWVKFYYFPNINKPYKLEITTRMDFILHANILKETKICN